MAATNRIPSMLSISLCFHFLLFSSFDPTKIFSNAENVGDGNKSTIKGMFVFGDSLLDNGNNNFLETIAKADYLPYGMDSPIGPSGRFSNGKTLIDVLGELLNIKAPIPAYFDPSTKGNHTDFGVTYACGASGILDETSSTAGGVPNLDKQIKEFEDVTFPELQKQGETRESLSKYLFVIGSGGNDYTLNHLMNGSHSNVSVHELTANLTTTLSSQLKRLYNLGAQKFVLLSLYPLGCSPLGTAAQPKRKGCNKIYNEAALLFNAHLKSLVKRIRSQMPGPNLVMVNAYNIIRDIIKNPTLNGFNDVAHPCCQLPARTEGETGILCIKGGSTCEDRNKYLYFDGFHPTEAVNVVLATKAFSSHLTSEVYPFSIRKLAQI